MNRDRSGEKDFLSKYVNPGSRIAAPEGFTKGVMNRIESETALYPLRGLFGTRIAVPAITIMVTISLITMALIFLPHTDSNMFPEILTALDRIKINLPEINADWLYSISIPAIILYIAGGFLALSLFDRLLYRLFHS